MTGLLTLSFFLGLWMMAFSLVFYVDSFDMMTSDYTHSNSYRETVIYVQATRTMPFVDELLIIFIFIFYLWVYRETETDQTHDNNNLKVSLAIETLIFNSRESENWFWSSTPCLGLALSVFLANLIVVVFAATVT